MNRRPRRRRGRAPLQTRAAPRGVRACVRTSQPRSSTIPVNIRPVPPRPAAARGRLRSSAIWRAPNSRQTVPASVDGRGPGPANARDRLRPACAPRRRSHHAINQAGAQKAPASVGPPSTSACRTPRPAKHGWGLRGGSTPLLLPRRDVDNSAPASAQPAVGLVVLAGGEDECRREAGVEGGPWAGTRPRASRPAAQRLALRAWLRRGGGPGREVRSAGRRRPGPPGTDCAVYGRGSGGVSGDPRAEPSQQLCPAVPG